MTDTINTDVLNVETATHADVQAWCRKYLATLFDAPLEDIDPDLDFDGLGLDSAMAVAMLLDLEEQLGREVSPELLFEYATINELSAHIVDVIIKQVVEAA